MQGNPEVISRLEGVYRLVRAIEEQSHLQEHLYESKKWKRPARWFDAVEGRIHEECLHFVINRVNDLGGRVRPGYAFEPVVYEIEELEQALESMAARFGELRSALIAVCDVAERVSDYVTEDLSWGWARLAEKFQRKFEGRLAKLRLLGPNVYLAELV